MKLREVVVCSACSAVLVLGMLAALGTGKETQPAREDFSLGDTLKYDPTVSYESVRANLVHADAIVIGKNDDRGIISMTVREAGPVIHIAKPSGLTFTIEMQGDLCRVSAKGSERVCTWAFSDDHLGWMLMPSEIVAP